jgi:TonB family protein
LTEIPSETFALPPNATVWGNCDIEWKLKEKQHPAYPMPARQEHRQGTVILYGVIEEDGSVSHLQVVASAGRDLDESSKALSHIGNMTVPDAKKRKRARKYSST